MIAWIDAAGPGNGVRVFGLTVVERHLQALVRLATKPERVVIDLGADGPEIDLPAEILERIAVEWRRTRGDFAARLGAALAERGSDAMMLFAATMLADARLPTALAARPRHTVACADAERAVLVYLAADGPSVQDVVAGSDDLAAVPADLAAFARRLVAGGRAERLPEDEFNGFIRKLRRSVPYYLFVIDGPGKAAEVERFMFWSNYKGSTDLLTRYLYPPLVWLLVRPLARWRVHPNVVTVIGIVLALAAIPCWSAGWFGTGFLLAYAMSVLDSVDGKLARLTFKDSKLGNTLDHGLDMVHPPLWYLAWADGLGLDLDELGTFLGQAAIAVAVCYAFDRVILKIYPRFFNRAFHTHSRMDGLVRSVIARRNITLSIFLIGYCTGLATEAFYVVVTWQVATMLYHGLRTFWILGVQRAHLQAAAGSEVASV